VAHPAKLRRMNQQRRTGVNGGEHGRNADGVDHYIDAANFFRFVHEGFEDFNLFGLRIVAKSFFADEMDSHRGEFADLGTGLVRGNVSYTDAFGWDDARAFEFAGIDFLLELQYSRDRATAREHGGVTRIEEILHILNGLGLQILFRIAPHEVMVTIDEARNRGHAMGINGLHAGSVWRASGNGDNLSAASDDGAILNYVAVAHDDADVGDSQVLRCEMRGTAHARKENQRDKNKKSLHWFKPSIPDCCY